VLAGIFAAEFRLARSINHSSFFSGIPVSLAVLNVDPISHGRINLLSAAAGWPVKHGNRI
jgi:hypothetical protein